MIWLAGFFGVDYRRSHLLEASLLAAHPKAELLVLGADDGRLGSDHHVVGVVQQHGEGVLKAGGVGGAGGADEGRHALGKSEQMHCLVQKVSAQVVDGGATGDDLVLPLVRLSGGLLRTVTVKVGFELGNAAKGAVLDDLGEGHEVGVPAAVYRMTLLKMLPLEVVPRGMTYSGTQPEACSACWRWQRAPQLPCGWG